MNWRLAGHHRKVVGVVEDAQHCADLEPCKLQPGVAELSCAGGQSMVTFKLRLDQTSQSIRGGDSSRYGSPAAVNTGLPDWCTPSCSTRCTRELKLKYKMAKDASRRKICSFENSKGVHQGQVRVF